MKIKEINNKIARIAFSPQEIYPSLIASGTAAEQTDSSFNRPTLDLFKLDLSNPSLDLELNGSIETESRFSKLIWSEYSSLNSKNILIGGCENSKIYLYDYEKILNKQKTAVLKSLEKHTGQVFSLDINPFQHNLLASGASSSDIFIWDLNNPTTPMTPGAKLQPLDDINSVSWNRQVQHILASTSSGKCVVWDLRKNESIIKVSDTMSKLKAKQVVWHPDIATQMCLSSDDDQSPYLQIWDLRFATSPVRVLEGHQRGILSMAWCSQDSNLLISTGKDSRMLCWNPNNASVNGDILFDLTTVGQWCFDLSWSKRNPDLVCTSSFEGQVNIYGLMGGKYNVIQQTSSKIMDSFGVDGVGMPSSPTALPQQTTQIVQPLKLAPKWMKVPCRANFAFGGKLVTFGKFLSETAQSGDQLRPATPSQASNQRIFINQVVTDNDLVQKSHSLESALQTGNLLEYCNYKLEENLNNKSQEQLWKFILASFNQNKNEKFLELLGFNNEDLDKQLKLILKDHHIHANHSDANLDLNKLNLNGHSSTEPSSFFDQEHIEQNNSNLDAFNDIARSVSPVNLKFTNNTENLITELLLLGKYELVVDLLIEEERFTEAILISNFFDKNLLIKTQQKYFRHFNKNKFSNLLEKLLNRNWSGIIQTCNLEHWKEALATIITYTQGQEQMSLLDELGKRLEADGSESNLINACVCFICSANLDNLVFCWQKVLGEKETDTSSSLQDIVEKVMVLKFCIQNVHPELQSQAQSLSKLNSKLVKYAQLLADQGCFVNAYNYINDFNDQSILIMKDRLYHVIDPLVVQQLRLRKPDHPFKTNQQQHQQQTNLKNKPSLNQQNQSHLQTRKNLYQNATNNPTTQTFNPNAYNPNQFQQTNTSTPFASVNHPMPISNLYQNSNQNDLTNRSATPVKSFTQSAPPPANVFNPANSQSFFNPQNQQQQPSTQSQSSVPLQQQPQVQSFMHVRPATAWNDPPIVAPKIKQTQTALKDTEKPQFFQPTMPAAQSMPQFYQPQIQPQYQQPVQQFEYNQPQFQQQSQPVQTFQPQVPQQQQPPPQPAQVLQQPEKPAPVEKAPIPVEHKEIQDVFDSLLNKCLSSTNNPTTKRKLDDVAKKLEVLYDKLRDGTLSANVSQGLHNLVQYIKAHDFQSSLQLHSNIVGTSNFTEISGFMPGIKVLVQSCQQMNINY